jgi:hypothetical protein
MSQKLGKPELSPSLPRKTRSATRGEPSSRTQTRLRQEPLDLCMATGFTIGLDEAENLNHDD